MINLLWVLLQTELRSKQGITKRGFERGIKDHNYIQQFPSLLVEFLLPCFSCSIPAPLDTFFI
jgi:hypothetical protein